MNTIGKSILVSLIKETFSKNFDDNLVPPYFFILWRELRSACHVIKILTRATELSK